MEWIALKSGWLYERKNGLILNGRWEPRWVVIYGEPVPAIGVYEQRSDAAPPYAPLRHVDLPAETMVRTAGEKRHQAIAAGLMGWIRRASVDVGASMADLKVGGGEKERIFWVSSRRGVKLCFLANSKHDCDDWVGAIKGVLMGAAITAESATVPSVPVATNPTVTTAVSRGAADNGEMITCGGVLVMEGRIVSRIKASSTSGSTSNPLSRSNSDSDASGSADSIVGALNDSCAVIRETTDELDEINFKYQQTMLDRFKCGASATDAGGRDLLRLELQALKLLGRFHDIVSKKLVHIVDEYHCGRTSSTTGESKFEEGPLKLMFIADYGNAEEELIATAYAWLRQEIIASRWIASKRSAGLLQPLMTILEYKGFRALAMLNLPLAPQTMVHSAESGIMDEQMLQKLKSISTELNLTAPYPYRMVDGRVAQISLSPALEVHKLESASKTGPLSKTKVVGARTPPGLYITNVHDIVPAYPVTEDLRGLLYFRPEFISTLPSPVAPGDMQPESKQLVLRVLRDTRLAQLLGELQSLNEIPVDSEEWRLLMHKHGLNMALLGAVAEETKLPHVREGALIEMLARTAKLILRSRLRSAILHFREVQALRVEEELVTIVLETLNGVLLQDPTWMDEMIPAVEDRFGYKAEIDTIKHLSRNALLAALQHHCSVRLREAAYVRGGHLEPADFLGFGVQLVNGGNGPFHLTQSKDALSDFANVVLATGASLWQMEGRRAYAAKMILKLVEEHVEGARWDEAWRWAEFAAGLCPRQHPNQVPIHLMMTRIKVQGPVNLAAWRPPMTLGEKPSAGCSLSREETLLEEVKKAKVGLLHKVDRHFGAHHPVGIRLRLQLAQLMERVSGGVGNGMELVSRGVGNGMELVSRGVGNGMELVSRGVEGGLQLRREALAIAHKVLGRQHAYSQRMLADYADALVIGERYDEAMAAYGEALKLTETDEEETETKAHLQFGLMKCWREKGDFEMALQWATRCKEELDALESGHRKSALMEGVLEEIAELSVRLYDNIDLGTTGVDTATFHSPLKALLSEEFIAEPIAKHLQMAIACYAKLFEARRTRHDLDTADGEALLRLVKKIVLLTLRLASPAQRPVIKAAARRKMFTRQEGEQPGREAVVKDLLVRMVAGPATPQDILERVLMKAQNVESIAEAEADLAVLLDLIEIVQ